MKQSRYLTAREAAEALDVSVATVYAYVSRGLIRSELAGLNQRARLYVAEDVQKLIEQKAYRNDPGKAANTAMQWGMPILESALTLIDETGLYYRGIDVTQLATNHSIEQVAALLWTGEMTNAATIFATQPVVSKYLHTLQSLEINHPDLPLLQKLQIVLALAVVDDLAAYDLDTQFSHPEQVGARILQLMTAVLNGSVDIAVPIAQALQQSWCGKDAPTERLFNAVLILCADHELNASAFTARVVASVEANLYQVVIAGLAALQGFKHGGNTILVESLIHEIETGHSVRQVIATRLRRGEQIPGFSHRLYPHGDPRGAFLLDLIAQTYANASSVQLAQTIIAVVEEATGRKTNLDFALVTLARTLHLPEGSALTLFALGRTVGWVGHAIEQYNTGQMIRPRATYIGPRSNIVQITEQK